MFRKQEEIQKELDHWEKNMGNIPELMVQLKEMKHDKKKVTDAFYKNLEFGTGGLRGIMGVGTNRMNLFTVARASRGVAAYIKKHFTEENRSVAISYDSRNLSEEFSRKAAEIFASCGIRVYIYPVLQPTPLLSWAVRELNCSAGIMITASHNPAEYNGYKVYGSDGCQITVQVAKDIMVEIEASYYFGESKELPFEMEVKLGLITFISNDIIDGFMKAVRQQSLVKKDVDAIDKEISIVYSPLNGTGLIPVVRCLEERGFKKIFVVPEQKFPDGNFTTCPIPNPEEPESMEMGIRYAKKVSADIIIATDPDCDRVGVAVEDENKSYVRLSGNEIGVLLLDYICKRRIENGTMPEKPVFMKSIVSTDLAERIAEYYGVQTINLLTGFKFIGEQIGIMEQIGEKDNFVFGFEESLGYLSGSYVRDKDGVGGSLLICEMAAYYKKMEKNLLSVLADIYGKHGFHLNTLHTYTFEGLDGFQCMEIIMKKIGTSIIENLLETKINMFEFNVISAEDYLLKRRYEKSSTSELLTKVPKTNMLKLNFDNSCSIIVRPSGTENKIKVYSSVLSSSFNAAIGVERVIIALIEKIIGVN
ncbi:phospho-sugar mutase [Lacrimispora sp.]|uniref:phospho-sugar mutase n=1 Tax=Lacrimispora sp. TaxID=2719234 RepID=UPI0032E457EC